MADSSWEAVKEKITDDLLNLQDTDTDLTLVDTANPVNWSRFAKTLVGAFIAAFTLGLGAIQQAFFTVNSALPSGISSFTEDLIVAVFTLPGNVLETAAATTAAAAETYGVLAYVVAVASVMVALYAASKAVEVIR